MRKIGMLLKVEGPSIVAYFHTPLRCQSPESRGEATFRIGCFTLPRLAAHGMSSQKSHLRSFTLEGAVGGHGSSDVD